LQLERTQDYSRAPGVLSTAFGIRDSVVLRNVCSLDSADLEGGMMNKDIQGLIYGSCLASIAISIYLFVTGKKDTGIFIGLWAPTILGLGTFFSTEKVPGAGSD
jgi:hypothetical protein